MWPNLLEYGWLKISVFGVYSVVAVIVTSFILWRKLREEMPDEDVFGLTLNLFVGLGIGNTAGSLLETGKWLSISGWGLVIGGLWAFWNWCRTTKTDFWELFDWFSSMALWLWFFGSIAYGPEAKYATAAAFAAMVAVKLVKANYRKFRWYKSGRVGIVGLTAVVMYSGYEVVTGIIAPVRVYWWGMTLGQTVFAWVIAVSLVTVYLRGGNRLKF